MAKKQFEVNVEQINAVTYTIEASNKQAATNKAVRKFREENKNPEIISVVRVKVTDEDETATEDTAEEATEE